MRRLAAVTLPLFGESEARGEKPRRGQMPPSALALHIYWSASVEAQALGAAAVAAALPAERRALLELQKIEQERKEAARRLLQHVWGVRIAASASAARPAQTA
jgi:hypothetical protein